MMFIPQNNFRVFLVTSVQHRNLPMVSAWICCSVPAWYLCYHMLTPYQTIVAICKTASVATGQALSMGPMFVFAVRNLNYKRSSQIQRPIYCRQQVFAVIPPASELLAAPSLILTSFRGPFSFYIQIVSVKRSVCFFFIQILLHYSARSISIFSSHTKMFENQISLTQPLIEQQILVFDIEKVNVLGDQYSWITQYNKSI